MQFPTFPITERIAGAIFCFHAHETPNGSAQNCICFPHFRSVFPPLKAVYCDHKVIIQRSADLAQTATHISQKAIFKHPLNGCKD